MRLKGLTIRSWRSVVIRETAKCTNEDVKNSLHIFAGLVKLGWLAPIQFWEAHLERQFESHLGNTATYQTGALNTSKGYVLFTLKGSNVCQDTAINTFLSTLKNFGPVQLLCSFDNASTIMNIECITAYYWQEPVRSIFTYPGFT